MIGTALRRTSSGWTPASLPNLMLWLDASDSSTITASAGAVSTWTDKSTNAYTFTQATPAAKPTTGSATQNGLNALSFDGGDVLASSAASSTWKWLHDGTSTYGFYIGFKYSAGSSPILCATGRWVGGYIGALFLLNGSASGTYSYVYGAAAVDVDARSNLSGRGTSANLIGFIMDPSNGTAGNRSIHRLNGAQSSGSNASSGSVSSSDSFSTLSIGADQAGQGYYTGNIFEIVAWKSPVSADWTALETYLLAKWGIS